MVREQQWLVQPIGVLIGERSHVEDRVRGVDDTMVIRAKNDHIVAGIRSSLAEVLNVMTLGVRSPKSRLKVISADLASVAVIGLEVRRKPGIALVLKLGEEGGFLVF